MYSALKIKGRKTIMKKCFETKVMRKVFAASLALAVAALGAGCASGGNAQSGTDAASAGASQGAPKEVTTISIWTGSAHDKSFMTEQVNQWNQTVGKEKGIQIDYQVKDKADQMVDLAFVSGQAPDIFGVNDLEKLVTEGRIAALEDLPGGPELVKQYEGKLTPYKQTYMGKTYNLTGGVTTYGIIYNKDMFKAAGIVDEKGEAKPPETFDELREYAKKLTNPSKNEYGIALPAKWSAWFDEDIRRLSSASTGILQWDPVTGKYNYDAQGKVMEVLVGIKADGSCLPGAEGLDNDPARARFAEGGIGMKTAASYDYGVLTDQFPAKIDWGVAPYPVFDKNDKYKQAMGFGRYLAINLESTKKKDPAAIMEVFKWLHSDELVIEKYKQGLAIPYDFNLVKDIKLDDKMKQWAEFASMMDVSVVAQQEKVPSDLGNQRTIDKIWLEDIWTGKVPADQIPSVCKQYAQTMDEATAKYLKLHPDVDINQFIDPDWRAKTKR